MENQQQQRRRQKVNSSLPPSSSSSPSSLSFCQQQQEQKLEITGEIVIPTRCFHPRPKITIVLQDASRIDRKPIDISSQVMTVAFITAGDKIPFALTYTPDQLVSSLEENATTTENAEDGSLTTSSCESCDVVSKPPPQQQKKLQQQRSFEWYILQVRIESTVAEAGIEGGIGYGSGTLLCFNHRVTRAIDDSGVPMQGIQIPLINATLSSMFHSNDLNISSKEFASSSSPTEGTPTKLSANKSRSYSRPVRRKSKIENE